MSGLGITRFILPGNKHDELKADLGMVKIDRAVAFLQLIDFMERRNVQTYNHTLDTDTSIQVDFKAVGGNSQMRHVPRPDGNKSSIIKIPRLASTIGNRTDETEVQINITLERIYREALIELQVFRIGGIVACATTVQIEAIYWMEIEAAAKKWLIPCMVLEFTPLGTIEQFINQHRPDFRSLVSFCFDIAEALDYLHKSGVAHCDIKPANILVYHGDRSFNHTAKLGDFGSSITNFDVVDLDALNTHNFTKEFQKFPGDFLNLEPDLIPYLDLFSLGVTIWCIFLGAPCYSRDNLSVLSHILQQLQPDTKMDQGLPWDYLKNHTLIKEIACENIKRTERYDPMELSFIERLLGITFHQEPFHRSLTTIIHIILDYFEEVTSHNPVGDAIEDILRLRREGGGPQNRPKTYRPPGSEGVEPTPDFFVVVQDLRARDSTGTTPKIWLKRLHESIFMTLDEWIQDPGPETDWDGKIYLNRGLCYLTAQGTAYNAQMGVKDISRAAELGLIQAKAIVGRLSSSFGIELQIEQATQHEWLIEGVISGSSIAKIQALETPELGVEGISSAMEKLAIDYGGIGRNIHESQSHKNHPALHLAVMTWQNDDLELLEKREVLNAADETALLCSVRANNWEAFEYLRDRAWNNDPGQLSIFFENCFHWVCIYRNQNKVTDLLDYFWWRERLRAPAQQRHHATSLPIGSEASEFPTESYYPFHVSPESMIGSSPLSRAIFLNNPMVVEALLSLDGAGWDSIPSNQWSKITHAEKVRRAEEFYLDGGEDFWQSATFAAGFHLLGIVKIFIDRVRGYKTYHEDLKMSFYRKMCKTALQHPLLVHCALIHGHRRVEAMKETLNYLLGLQELQPDVSSGSLAHVHPKRPYQGLFGDNSTPLLWAVRGCKSRDVVDYLLQQPETIQDINSRNNGGGSALSNSILLAALSFNSDQLDIVQKLIEHPVFLKGQPQGNCVLWWCIESGVTDPAFIQQIMDLTQNTMTQADKAKCFSLAVRMNVFTVARLLLEDTEGLCIKQKYGVDLVTALGDVVNTLDERTLPGLKFLLEPTKRYPNQTSAASAINKEYSTIDFIVDGRIRDTALSRMMRFDRERCDKIRNQNYPRHWVDDSLFLKIMHYLIGKLPRPDMINHTTTEGLSALHIAASNLNIEAVKTLLENGADPRLSTNSSIGTPLDYLRNSRTEPERLPITKAGTHSTTQNDIQAFEKIIKILQESLDQPRDNQGRNSLSPCECESCLQSQKRLWRSRLIAVACYTYIICISLLFISYSV